MKAPNGRKPGDQPLSERELRLAGLIWRKSPISRWELHEITRLHPNLVGNAIQKLIDVGLICEGAGIPSSGTGRPRVPLKVDDVRRNIIGLSISPGDVQLLRVNLAGKPMGQPIRQTAKQNRLIPLASELLKESINEDTLAVGVSITGFVDPSERQLLLSSSAPMVAKTSLSPIYDAAGELPLMLDNDMHALAARWLLSHGDETEDTLLVGIDDGRLGASMLIAGKPNRGCVTAANELGHMRLAVDTERCYCGQPGCLERIFSTDYFHRIGGNASMSLAESINRLPQDSQQMQTILDHLTTGLANAVNFMRPTRLIIGSPFAKVGPFSERIETLIRQKFLQGLSDRVRIEHWEQSSNEWSASAAWLALAHYFGESWKSVEQQQEIKA